jgi:hypothetical protein
MRAARLLAAIALAAILSCALSLLAGPASAQGSGVVPTGGTSALMSGASEGAATPTLAPTALLEYQAALIRDYLRARFAPRQSAARVIRATTPVSTATARRPKI